MREAADSVVPHILAETHSVGRFRSAIHIRHLPPLLPGVTIAAGLAMIITSLLLQPLGPAIVLVSGAILLRVVRWLALQRAARSFPELRFFRLRLALALLTLLAAAVPLAMARDLHAGRALLSWSWQPLTVAGGVLQWRMDSWNWLTALLILLITAVAVLLDRGALPEGQDGASWRGGFGTGQERTLCLGAAALILTSSGNVLTLASSWVLMDGVLGWYLRPAERAEPAARAWGLLSVAGVLLLAVLALLGEGGLRADLTTPSMDRWEVALLWLAALIRAGIYPLHFWLIGPAGLNRSSGLALSGAAPIAGLWMLARMHAVAPAAWLHRPEWAALGAVALLGTALVAWTASQETSRLRWIAINRASLVVLAAYMAGLAAPETLAWALVTFVLGYALLVVGQEAQERLGWRIPVWLAAFALWGLPGTTGFLARWALVFPTQLPWAVPVFGIIVLSETLLVAALWQVVAGGGREPLAAGPVGAGDRQVSAALGLAALLLATPLIIWGMMPGRLARLVGWPVGEAFPALWSAVVHARKSVWAGLALSAALGVPLGVFRKRIFSDMLGWQRGISAFVSLDWLYRAAVGGLNVAASVLQYFARLGEGEGYLGWLVLAGFLLWVLLRG